jgi:hypothetical protein
MQPVDQVSSNYSQGIDHRNNPPANSSAESQNIQQTLRQLATPLLSAQPRMVGGPLPPPTELYQLSLNNRTNVVISIGSEILNQVDHEIDINLSMSQAQTSEIDLTAPMIPTPPLSPLYEPRQLSASDYFDLFENSSPLPSQRTLTLSPSQLNFNGQSRDVITRTASFSRNGQEFIGLLPPPTFPSAPLSHQSSSSSPPSSPTQSASRRE